MRQAAHYGNIAHSYENRANRTGVGQAARRCRRTLVKQ